MLQQLGRKGVSTTLMGLSLAGILILVPVLMTFGLEMFPSGPSGELATMPTAPPVPKSVSQEETFPEDGRFGVAKQVFLESKSLGRPTEALGLAEAFQQTAEKVRNEKPSVWSILSWIKSASDNAIPETSRKTWADLQTKLSRKLTSLYGSGRLSSPSDWADCFAEVGRGLEAAGAHH